MKIKPICGVKGKVVVFWLDIGIFAEVWPVANRVRPIATWMTPSKFMPYDEFLVSNELPEEMIEAATKVFFENFANARKDFADAVAAIGKERIMAFKKEAERTWRTTLEFDDDAQS